MSTFQFTNNEIEYTFNAEGEIEFRHNDILYRSVGAATFDNSPSNDYSTYSAPLYSEDVDCPTDKVGKIEWDIINPDCADESDACDWDKFNIYF